ncbi:hypothetical protein SAMN05444404_0509 [Ruegeria lacuscaerulensis ITI-1157]|nr:hypothetical protein SAMN05444404_0509 [Ruegeria lacuscaerulensis ITI-1157]
MSLLNQLTIKSVLGRLKRLKNSEDGLITVEAVLMVPLLFWSLTASYTFFNSYHQSARNLKAAYAVADVISRERGTINATYVDTLYSLLKNMVADRSEMHMRVSFVEYDKDDDKHLVHWSCIRGTKFPKWTDGTINEIKTRLPVMPDHGRMILVETSNTYRPPFKLWITRDEYDMDNFVFTHPRVYDNIHSEDSC